MISTDMIGPLVIARDAQISGVTATNLETARWHLKRLGVALTILEDAADRVKALEQQTVPPHWRQQSLPPGDLPENVIPLPCARHIPITHGGAA